MLGTAKKTDHPDTGVCFPAGTQRIPHKNSRMLDTRSLADTARHYHRHHRHHHNLPHLEAQA